MSSFLYSLGRAAYRRRLAVLLGWLTLLGVVAAVAFTLQKGFDENFSLPGTESQEALDSLNRTFPQVSGTTAQVVVVTPEGGTVRSAAVRDAIEISVQRLEQIDQVDRVTSPFDKYTNGAISDDDRAAITSVGLNVDQPDIAPSTYAALDAETKRLQSVIPGSQVSAGGEAYGNEPPGVTPTEGIGVLVALLVLLLTLGSLRAAGMPLLTAILGVALTMLLIIAATGVTTISSTTPLLALMLGLAVGIDYALFITSRHRDQLRDGLDAEESAARALATAGSAVVFAGMTVMIALCGLAVAGIPFLTTMGVAASIGVGIAVLIALTLLPALLGFAGERLRPRQRNDGTCQGNGPDLAPDASRWIGAWLAEAGHQGAGRHRADRRDRAGHSELPGQGPAPRAAEQRDGRSRVFSPHDLRPDQRALRPRLQRAAHCDGGHRQL